MADHLKDVLAGAVDPAQGDEGPPKVVTAAVAKAQSSQILKKLVARVVTAPDPTLPRRQQGVVWRGLTTHQFHPSAQLPRIEDSRQGGVDRNLAGSTRLGARASIGPRNDQPGERLRARVEVAPAEARHFAMAESRDSLQGVRDATIPRDFLGRDEHLKLVPGEDGLRAPLRILVLLFAELRLSEHAWRRVQYLFDHGIAEQGVEKAVDVLNRGGGNFGTGNLTGVVSTSIGAGTATSLSLGDLNGDGHRDIALATTTEISVLKNLGP